MAGPEHQQHFEVYSGTAAPEGHEKLTDSNSSFNSEHSHISSLCEHRGIRNPARWLLDRRHQTDVPSIA